MGGGVGLHCETCSSGLSQRAIRLGHRFCITCRPKCSSEHARFPTAAPKPAVAHPVNFPGIVCHLCGEALAVCEPCLRFMHKAGADWWFPYCPRCTGTDHLRSSVHMQAVLGAVPTHADIAAAVDAVAQRLPMFVALPQRGFRPYGRPRGTDRPGRVRIRISLIDAAGEPIKGNMRRQFTVDVGRVSEVAAAVATLLVEQGVA